MRSTDTIFAPSSGSGRAAVSVIRISGAAAGPALAALTGRALPSPRRAALRRLSDPATGAALDHVLALWLPGPTSFTGEDVVELHGHGGPAVRTATLAALATLPDLRLARPGEFTRRALLNGRLDLAAAEGLGDLIEAETEAQRRQALLVFGGALARAIEGWSDRLLDALAEVEAALDFSDEDDVSDGILGRARDALLAILDDVRRELDRSRAGERLREGAVVVIAGPPNAGKSTLLNAIVRRDVAIVTPHAGTTRDPIEVRCDLGGMPVSFIDTAGVRDSADPVERIGIARALARAAEADLVLWLSPRDAPAPKPPPDIAVRGGAVLPVSTKADLGADDVPPEAYRISAATGDGLGELLAEVERRISTLLAPGDVALVTRERQRVAMEGVVASLGRSLVALEGGHGELAAEDIRSALRDLGSVDRPADLDAVLDRVFARFCIGK